MQIFTIPIEKQRGIKIKQDQPHIQRMVKVTSELIQNNKWYHRLIRKLTFGLFCEEVVTYTVELIDNEK